MHKIALAVLSLLACAQNGYYWTQLPDRVATHFGINGQPDDWMSKGSATLLMLAVQIAIPWFLVGIGFAIRYIPAPLINIPHREYWLHPDRRLQSIAFVQRFVTAIACIMSLFTMSINHLTFRANMAATSLNMQAFALVMGLFFVGVAVLVISMLRRFRMPVLHSSLGK